MNRSLAKHLAWCSSGLGKLLIRKLFNKLPIFFSKINVKTCTTRSRIQTNFSSKNIEMDSSLLNLFVDVHFSSFLNRYLHIKNISIFLKVFLQWNLRDIQTVQICHPILLNSSCRQRIYFFDYTRNKNPSN